MKRFLLFLLATIIGNACYAQCSLDLGQDTVLFCEGECIEFDAGQTWSSYSWSSGDSIASICHGQTGILTLSVVDNQGCVAVDSVYLIELVYNAYASETEVCEGQDVELTANIYGAIEPAGALYDTTYLPDGNGVNYETSIQIQGFNPGQTFNAGTQDFEICATMEHSYLGDLEMMLTCPNGTDGVVFNSWPGTGINTEFAGGFGGVGTYLGDALDGGLGTPGIGWDYCFSDVASWGTLGDEFSLGNTMPAPLSGGSAMASGTYKPEQAFDVFDGCPLNGNWTLTVRDNIAIDDGYIMFWGLGLSHELEDPQYFWSTGDSISNFQSGINDTLVTVEMSIDGTACYDTINFMVNELPDIIISVDPSDCMADNGVINNLSPMDSLIMEVYNMAGIALPPSLLDPGLYNVSVINPQGCQVDTVVEVTVAIDSVDNITGATVVFPGQQFTYSVPYSECLNYVWTIDNGTIDSGQGTNSVSVTWNDSISGWIAVNMAEIRDFNQELILYVGTATAIAVQESIEFQTFPNPVNSLVRITSNQEIQQISILDLSGRTIQSISTNSRTVDVDMEHFSRGPYVIRILSASGESSKLMIKD